MAYIQFLGAAGTVTGSKHLINTGDLQVLIDCGLFQGKKEWREKNWQDLQVTARDIDAVILTHAHLDHCGWIPRLYKEGYRGKVYATPSTIDLCGVILPDSGHLQEEDAEFANRKKTSKHTPALPLYTQDDAEECLKHFLPIGFHKPQRLSPKLEFEFVHAGHILGSGMVRVNLDGRRQILFSGDIGRVKDTGAPTPGKVVHEGPERGEAPELLVMESTYGNRQHPKEDSRPKLANFLRTTAQRGGTVIVPAFAVERTQKFLFLIKELMESGDAPALPVFVDSPMAIKAVNIFLKHTEEYSQSTQKLIERFGSPLKWPGFTFASDVNESKKINELTYPSIIVSSSGMVTGGRILHHLRHRLSDPRNLVLFIGFQAPGTRGAVIKSGAPTVKIFGEEVAIRAQVGAIEQFSDHADTPELLTWLRTFKSPPKRTYLVHGEPEASAAMRDAFVRELGWKVEVAQWLERVEI